MRGSKKPCPGCGLVKLGRPAKEVCLHCKRLLERAKWLEEIMSEMGDDEIVVAFGERTHTNEYIHSQSGVGESLMEIFLHVALAGSRPATTWHAEFELLGKINASFLSYAIMSRPLAEAVRDLRIVVGKALEQEYEQGKKDGHNLLMRLAEGDISTSDFDEAITR